MIIPNHYRLNKKFNYSIEEKPLKEISWNILTSNLFLFLISMSKNAFHKSLYF